MRPVVSVAALAASTFLAVMFTGCDCRALERKSSADDEERRFDELLRKNAPPIPSSRAVGCDVCPAHCQHQDLGESLSMSDLRA